ncbi:hypothetical protein AAGT00_00975 (plasmid) [Streptomyces cavourensis]
MRIRKLSVVAASLAAVSAFTLVNAPSAAAYSCHKDGIYTRCLNGFKRTDWKPGTSFMVLNNGYSYKKTVAVWTTSGGPITFCIAAGGTRTFDRDTYNGYVIPGSTGC